MAIFQDNKGYPVESHNDGGDSSMRAGMGTLSGLNWPKPFNLADFEIQWGWMTRHPTQPVWSSPLNSSRDQLVPYLAGLNQIGRNDVIRRLAAWHLMRLGLCQNFQRDKPGTWKLPYPSTYVNDRGETVTKAFDFADPTLPNHWWCFIKGGHLYPLYVLYPICLLFALLSIYSSIGTGKEQNQVIAEMSFHPTWMMRLYVKWNPSWNENNALYWVSRGEKEYSDAIADYVNKRCLQ